MKVREFMSAPVHCVQPRDSVVHARKEMIRHGIAHLPVVDDAGGLLGVLSLADLVLPKAEALRRRAWPGTVDQAMTSGALTLAPSASDAHAAGLLSAYRVSCAPVIEDRAVIGIVCAVDVLRALQPRAHGFRVERLARPGMPGVSRHASPAAILRAMQESGVREVAVTEGQAFITDRPPAGLGDGADAVHRGRTAVSWGIVGMVSLASLVSSAWFDEHAGAGPRGKWLSEARRTEAGGPKRLRHVELVDAVAENMMTREVRALLPGDDVSVATRLFVETGASALPVLGAAERPGFLDRHDLLAALAKLEEPD